MAPDLSFSGVVGFGLSILLALAILIYGCFAPLETKEVKPKKAKEDKKGKKDKGKED